MEHLVKVGKKEKIFVLLHGTGGDEYSLIAVAEMLDPQASIIAFRGDVQENGMNRFFRREAEGVYDEIDLKMRTHLLQSKLQELLQHYQWSMKDVVVIGYSNGANIALSLLFANPNEGGKWLLFHPMFPLDWTLTPAEIIPQLFISAGRMDPIVPITETIHVIHLLKQIGSQPEVVWSQDHHLAQSELEQAKAWLSKMENFS